MIQMNSSKVKLSWFFLLLFSGIFSFDLVTKILAGASSDKSKKTAEQLHVENRASLSEDYLKFYTADTSVLSSYGYPSYYIPEFTEEIYQQRISELNKKLNIKLVYNKHVRGHINLYLLRNRSLTTRIIGRSYNYFPMFEQILEESGLPSELKNLAVVESALNNDALSWCGAAGIWQFMPATGKIYSLCVNPDNDERKNPELATRAAVKYLKHLHGIYKDWLLAIAAYNCGPGNVNKAIRKSGGKRDYWVIMRHMPKETQGYVPAFVAACYFMEYYHQHNLKAIDPEFLVHDLQPVQLSKPVSFHHLSKVLNVKPEELNCFNPGFEKNQKAGVDSTLKLMLPSPLATRFYEKEHLVYEVSPLKASMDFLASRLTTDFFTEPQAGDEEGATVIEE